MAIKKRFFRCEICGNLIGVINDGGGPLVCCGKPMTELVAGSVDAATEKHVPVYTLNGDRLDVQVGSTPHPMQEDHWIQWICVTDGTRTQRVKLNPGDEPKASFIVDPAAPLSIYEYCNLHGLWEADK